MLCDYHLFLGAIRGQSANVTISTQDYAFRGFLSGETRDCFLFSFFSRYLPV
jgi:hypothetical protein